MSSFSKGILVSHAFPGGGTSHPLLLPGSKNKTVADSRSQMMLLWSSRKSTGMLKGHRLGFQEQALTQAVPVQTSKWVSQLKGICLSMLICRYRNPRSKVLRIFYEGSRAGSAVGAKMVSCSTRCEGHGSEQWGSWVVEGWACLYIPVWFESFSHSFIYVLVLYVLLLFLWDEVHA